MIHSSLVHAFLQSSLDQLVTVTVLDHLKLDLLVEGWDKVSSHGVVLAVTQETNVFQLGQRIALEELKELLRHGTGDITLLVSVSQNLMDSLLQVASINFIVAASLTSLNTLCLHKHGFSVLLVSGVMLGEKSIFVRFDHLDSGLFETLAYEDLKNGLNFQVKVEEVRIDILNLNIFIVSLFVWNVGCTGRSVNVIIWLYLRLVDHVITIIKLNPVMHRLHHLLLLLLLIDLCHLLLLLLLRVALLVDVFAPIHLHLLLLFLILSQRKRAVTGNNSSVVSFESLPSFSKDGFGVLSQPTSASLSSWGQVACLY